MIILKILLTIIRIPCTVWYVLTGWLFLLFAIVDYYSTSKSNQNTKDFRSVWSFFALEFASLTKFYNIREANLDNIVKKIFKIATMAGMITGVGFALYNMFAK